MSSRLLQTIGVLAILALVGGSLAALLLVKQRIHVTFAAEEEAARRGPDPIELLREDVAALRSEVAALRKDPGAPAPANAPKKSFLAFDVPADAFAFDRRQRFAIVPSLSRVGFDAKSTLHDFSGVSSKVEGTLTVDLSKPGENPRGKLTVESASLDTGVAGRDEDMRKTLAVEQYPALVFEWTAFAPTAVDARALTITGTATGQLSIRGKTREVSLPVKVSVDASKRVAIEGQLAIKLGDYGVEPPSQAGLIKVADELVLWIALRARLVGPAKEGE